MIDPMEDAAANSPALWYDVTDIVKHKATWVGIPRVVGGLAIGLIQANHSFPLQFCHFETGRGFVSLTQKQLEHLISRVGTVEPQSPLFEKFHKFFQKRQKRKSVELGFPFRHGDVLFNVGLNTYKTQFQQDIMQFFDHYDIHYVGYIHDLIFYRFPEMWRPKAREKMQQWMQFTGEAASLILCSSRSTKEDADEFYARLGLKQTPIVPIGLASGLMVQSQEPSPSQDRVTPEKPYVLCVSTLEVRKNHRLLFHVWKNLVSKYGSQAVPRLVFAGKKGWLIDDFISELENCNYLDGLIQWLPDVDDHYLNQLYRDCLFTVYPSYYEGWGLPLAESLSFGKYCIASNSSSLPEVGGTLIDYHKPFDVDEATELVTRAINDPAFLRQREAKIRSEYQPRSWVACASAAVAAMEEILKPFVAGSSKTEESR